MVNLLIITSFNDYIISPRTWLHNIKHKQKLFFVFFYLCFFYYCKNIYSILGIIFCLIITITTKIPLKKIISKVHILLYYFIFLLNIITHTSDIKFLFQIHIKIFFNPKTIKKISTLKKLEPDNISNTKDLFLLPKFVVKIASISLNSYLYLKILFSTTKYENIILYMFGKVNKILSISQQTTFIMTMSSQFFLVVTQKIFLMILSIQLRSMNRIFILEYTKILYLILIELLVFSKIYVGKISYTLYIRKINYINFMLTNY
uniref:hypothetical protein n=1 Tax=Catenella fusiformis TaxID=3024791 RepID=UPI0027DAAD79|nr:hypothetical protein REQ04_pgp116 [Catenella fusiformis]WCH57511.1 hypothetical protein [Catenella fusiformis]